eukprot:g3896.t1
MTTATTAGIPPNQTLYLSNLNHKVHKEVVRRALYGLFTQYGRILDIVVSRADGLRGQAWVVFRDIGAATNALRQAQGFPFFDRPLRVQFARDKSFAVAREDGTFFQVVKARAQRREGGSGGEGGEGGEGAAAEAMDTSADGEGAEAPAAASSSAAPPPPAAAAAAATPAIAGEGQGGGNPPHNVLLAAGLPAQVTAEMLQALFRQYHGFREVRLAGGKGVAFVEYENDVQAGVAVEGLDGFKLTPTDLMSVAFAKK